METIGLDGQTTTMSARSSASRTPGPGPADSAPSKRTLAHRHLVAQADEVVLEADLGPGRAQRAGLGQGQPRAQRVVGHRQEPHRHAAPCRQRCGDRAERLTGRAAGPCGTGGWPGPGHPAANQSSPTDAGQLGQDVPGLAGHAPPGVTVVHAGQGVGDRVDVGADVEAVQHHVVAHVDHGRDVRRPGRRAPGPRASGRHRHHRTGRPTRGEHREPSPGVGARRPWYHRRPPCRSRSPRTGTPPSSPSCGRPQPSTATSRPTWSRPWPGPPGAASPSGPGTAPPTAWPASWPATGWAKGDVVCLLLPSSIDYAVLYAALQRLGAITSGINPRMGAAEVASIVERAAPGPRRRRPRGGVPPVRTAVATLSRAEAAAAWDGAPPDLWPELAPHDPVAVVWTSGTTGRPKGAVFDHANLAAVARGTDVLEPTRRPPSLTPTLRPRRLHDPHVGRGGARRDDRDHPHALEGRRRHPDHGRGGRHRGPGRAHPVGPHAGQRRAGAGRPGHPAHRRDRRRPHDGRHDCRNAPPAGRARRRPLHLDRGISRDGDDPRVDGRGGGHDRGPPRPRRGAGHRRRRGARRCPRARSGRVLAALCRGHAGLLGPGPGSWSLRVRADRRRGDGGGAGRPTGG